VHAGDVIVIPAGVALRCLLLVTDSLPRTVANMSEPL
jgi:hypothetical protein